MHRHHAIAMSVLLLGAAACSASGSASDGDPASAGSEVRGAVPSESSDSWQSADGSSDGFCTAISAIQSADFELEETFGNEARQLFDDVQSSAPREIADDVGTVVAALDAIAELGVSTEEDDPVAIDAAVEILLDPDFTEANENLAAYTSEACGIDLGEGDDVDFDDLGGLDDVDAGDESDVDSDGPEAPDDDEPFDPSVISIEGLQMFFEADPSTADLLDDVVIYNVIAERNIDLRGSSVDEAAEQICRIALEYALELEPDATVRVADVEVAETSEVVAEFVGDGSTDGCAPV
ncbi:MAG: hypothetical protein ABJH68_14555 [Ilumatobacter sp.]|uniref:hypothetical protein n=1 Tax=Ilumatobacter sp. TaxID=1967498 RepID=UPI0032970034